MAFYSPLLLQWFGTLQQVFLDHPLSFTFFIFTSPFVLLSLKQDGARKQLNLPPSPSKLPIIGHLHHMGTLPHRSLQSLSNKHGPLTLMQLGKFPTFVVQTADMAKEIMKTHDMNFINRPSVTASREFLCDGKDISFAPYGEHWRQMRKLCVLDLLSSKRVQSFRSVRQEEIGIMVDQIRNSSLSGKEVNLSELIIYVTSNITTRVACNGRLENRKHAELAKELMKLFGHITMEDMFLSLKWVDVLTGINRKMKKVSEEIKQFVNEVIDDHLKARKDNDRETYTKDFIDLLLDYQDESVLDDRVDFTRDHIRRVIFGKK